MRDKWLIEEIKEKFRENDYPGSSLNCGVYPLFYNHGKSVAIYYPAKNCILLDDDKIIKHVYSHAQADKLIIRCADNNYPPINNIKPENYSEKYYESVMDYKNINLLLPYSGHIIIGSDLDQKFEGRAFIGPHAYKTTYELKFKKGKFISSKDTSGTYEGI